jgi:hypothetical protein
MLCWSCCGSCSAGAVRVLYGGCYALGAGCSVLGAVWILSGGCYGCCAAGAMRVLCGVCYAGAMRWVLCGSYAAGAMVLCGRVLCALCEVA